MSKLEELQLKMSQEFTKFCTKNPNSRTLWWWRVPNANEPEIASPVEVEEFIKKQMEETWNEGYVEGYAKGSFDGSYD